MKPSGEWSRRNFLQTMAAAAPAVKLAFQGLATRSATAPSYRRQATSGKFTPIDLGGYFNTSPRGFGPRTQAKNLSGDSLSDGLIRTPGGEQCLRGIPFLMGAEGVDQKSWSVLSTKPGANYAFEILLQKQASFICLASFCDWDEGPLDYQGIPAPSNEKLGQTLAQATLIFEDGSQVAIPLRRRFEVNSPSTPWGFLSFASLPHLENIPRRLKDPLLRGTDWGDLQTGVVDNDYPTDATGNPLPLLWICALENPETAKTIRTIRLQAVGEDPFVVCGLTLFHGSENPLRRARLSVYKLTLPNTPPDDSKRWIVSVDLGVISRTYFLPKFLPEAWLSSPRAGLGESEVHLEENHLYVELTASPDATLTLHDTKGSEEFAFSLREAVPGRIVEAKPGSALRVEILDSAKVWVHGTVIDSATQRPTAARLAFRSPDGRYFPPYGHRTEINTGLFQEYGPDVKVLDNAFAYVDGTFQIELPAGEIYVEINKGFEYQALRTKLKIEPGQRELRLELPRLYNLRQEGWITADVHVHYISSTTALLEGQAEGINLINLLAAQWGDFFTNVGDLSHGAVASRDGETLVWPGTENRQHMLGHIGLLGGHGDPVFPMSAAGPQESYLGDPLWNSLAEWADECRKRDGLAVAVHFPKPFGEIAADIALGKIDAVEMYPYTDDCFNTFRFLEWYRYLNCGYRLPAVGGTDKMGAGIPVGANRTYAYLGENEFSMTEWEKAVRGGNTFFTTGPVLFFHVDNHVPGKEITLGPGGGTLEVLAQAKSFVPIHRLQIVLNGDVVASREERAGIREMVLKEKIHVQGPGWIAARCSSQLGPTVDSLAIAAHTSPVYLCVPGKELFSPATITHMLSLIDGSATWVEKLATEPGRDQLAKILKVLSEARGALHESLHRHGIPH